MYVGKDLVIGSVVVAFGITVLKSLPPADTVTR